MARRLLRANLIQPAVLLGHLQVAGLSLLGSQPHPLIVIMAIKFKANNAALVLLFNASKMLVAPNPRAWEFFLQGPYIAQPTPLQRQPI